MKSIRIFLLLSIVALMSILTSCNPNGDASKLLKTVPAKADAVFVMNVKSVIENAGCKVDGSKMEMSDVISKMFVLDKGGRSIRDAICDGDIGLRYSSAVGFVKGNRLVLTCLLDSPDKLVKFVEDYEMTAKEENDMTVIYQNDVIQMIINGKQLWIGDDISTVDVEKWSNLDKDDSMLANPCIDYIAASDADGGAVINLGELPSETQVAMEMAFKDARFMVVSFTLGDTSVKAKAAIYDKEGDLVECKYEYESINTSILSNLQGEAEVVAAINIPQKFIADALKLVGADTEMSDLLGGVSGTSGVACDVRNIVNDEFSLSAVVECKDANAATSLSNNISEKTANQIVSKASEKNVIMSYGEMSGKCDMVDLIGSFENCVMGVLWSDGLYRSSLNPNVFNLLKSAWFVVKKEDKSLVAEFEWTVGGNQKPLELLATIVYDGMTKKIDFEEIVSQLFGKKEYKSSSTSIFADDIFEEVVEVDSVAID